MALEELTFYNPRDDDIDYNLLINLKTQEEIIELHNKITKKFQKYKINGKSTYDILFDQKTGYVNTHSDISELIFIDGKIHTILKNDEELSDEELIKIEQETNAVAIYYSIDRTSDGEYDLEDLD